MNCFVQTQLATISKQLTISCFCTKTIGNICKTIDNRLNTLDLHFCISDLLRLLRHTKSCAYLLGAWHGQQRSAESGRGQQRATWLQFGEGGAFPSAFLFRGQGARLQNIVGEESRRQQRQRRPYLPAEWRQALRRLPQ